MEMGSGKREFGAMLRPSLVYLIDRSRLAQADDSQRIRVSEPVSHQILARYRRDVWVNR